MPDLRSYKPEAIEQAAVNYRAALQRKALNDLEAVMEMQHFRFLGKEAANWMLDPRSSQWFRFDGSIWIPSDPPVGDLQGAADIPWATAISPEELERIMADIFGEQEEFYGDPPTVLSALMTSLHKAYQEGVLSSEDVEDLAAEQFVVDVEGKAWTVGLQSLQWYRFEDGDWRQASGALDAQALLPLMRWPEQCENCDEPLNDQVICDSCGHMQSPSVELEREQAQVEFQTFLQIGMGSIPEAIAEDWEFPQSYPDLAIQAGPRCRSCGAVSPTGGIYCNQCATALGCSQCGAINRLEDRFCTQCGTELILLGFDL